MMNLKTVRQIIGGGTAAGAAGAAALGLESMTAPIEMKTAPKYVRRSDSYGNVVVSENPLIKKRRNRKLLAAGSSLAAIPFAVKAAPKIISNRIAAGIAKDTKAFQKQYDVTFNVLTDTKNKLIRDLARVNKNMPNVSAAYKDTMLRKQKEIVSRLTKTESDLNALKNFQSKALGSIKKARKTSILGGGSALDKIRKQKNTLFGKRGTLFGEKNIVGKGMQFDEEALKKLYKKQLDKIPQDLV